MPAREKLSKINLLPKDSFESSNLGRFLQWSLKTGRMLVVLTEFVVVLAFGSRFWFDKRLNDLTEEIDAKHAVVRSFVEIETRMRDVLSREERITEYLDNNLSAPTWLLTLINATPKNLSFKTMSFDDNNKINLSGVAVSEVSFAGLLANLSKQPQISKVLIKQTHFDDSKGKLEFELAVQINKATKN